MVLYHLSRGDIALPPLNCGSGQGRSAFDFTNDVLRPGLFGLGTGFCSSFVLISSEVVKTRTQMMTETVSSVDITKGILRERGLGGLFVGMDAQIMRDAPFYAVFFGSYEISKFGLFALSSGSIPEDVNYFLSGGIAGMVGWFVAMPFDVPKTILQSDPKGKVLGGYFPIMREVARKKVSGGAAGGAGVSATAIYLPTPHTNNPPLVASLLAPTQGVINGLFAGLGPTMVRAFPSNAALFLGVEWTKNLFDDMVAS